VADGAILAAALATLCASRRGPAAPGDELAEEE